MNNTARLATIDFVLQGVPAFKCLEGCHDCCGPVLMTRLERKRILERTGKTERQFDAEMMAAFNGAMHKLESIAETSGKCPLLSDGGCSVYDIRPAVCRLFGASESRRLICPHGAKPEVPLNEADTDGVLKQVGRLGY